MTQEFHANGFPSRTSREDVPIRVESTYRLRFTRHALQPENTTLAEVIAASPTPPQRLIAVIDSGVADAWPQVTEDLERYAETYELPLTGDESMLIVPGGERAKNERSTLERVLALIHDAKLCRHSYVVAIGGGAVLDVAGFAAATAHRGVRLIRLPTTTLAQADAGIGVKNGVNMFGKKNFLGTFAIPWAVINDEDYLTTLTDRDWCCGLSEAVKVAIVKDAAFFDMIESAAEALRDRCHETASPIIRRSAELHLNHIAHGGDPFELTTARPLDFGHWSAHKIEQMTDFKVRHGEAVAVGIALDVVYASESGLIPWSDAERVLNCLHRIGFDLFHDALRETDELLEGLEEFREHLGGELTIALIEAIGQQVDVHQIRGSIVSQAIARLEDCAAKLAMHGES